MASQYAINIDSCNAIIQTNAELSLIWTLTTQQSEI